MLSGARGRLASALRRRERCRPRSPFGACTHRGRGRRWTGGSGQEGAFDPALLELLVCPLSKKPLRYDASTNELINEELGIAYPIIDGIPNMIPQAARRTHQSMKQEERVTPDQN